MNNGTGNLLLSVVSTENESEKRLKIRRMVRRIVSLGSLLILRNKKNIQNWKKQGMRL